MSDQKAPEDQPRYPLKTLPLATLALYRTGEPSVKAMLLEELDSPEQEIRLDSIETLGQARDATVRKRLEGLLEDPDVYIRAQAARALGNLGVEESRSILAATAAGDGDPRVRKAALLALCRLGRPLPPAIPAKGEPLPPMVLWFHGEQPARLPAKSRDSVVKALQDEDSSVRLFAAKLLALGGDSAGKSFLTTASPPRQIVALGLAALGDEAGLAELEKHQVVRRHGMLEKLRVLPERRRKELVREAFNRIEARGMMSFRQDFWTLEMAGGAEHFGALARLSEDASGPFLGKPSSTAGVGVTSVVRSLKDKFLASTPPRDRSVRKKPLKGPRGWSHVTEEETLLRTWKHPVAPGRLLNVLGYSLAAMARIDAGKTAKVCRELIAGEDPNVSVVAGLALARTGESGAGPLARWLDYPISNVRYCAAIALALNGSRAGNAVLKDLVLIQHWPVNREYCRRLVELDALDFLGKLRNQIAEDADDVLEPPGYDQTFRNPPRFWKLQQAERAAAALALANSEAGLAWVRQNLLSVPDISRTHNRRASALSVLASVDLGGEGDTLLHKHLGPAASSRDVRIVLNNLTRSQAAKVKDRLLSLAQSKDHEHHIMSAYWLPLVDRKPGISLLKQLYENHEGDQKFTFARYLTRLGAPVDDGLLYEEMDEGEGVKRFKASLALAIAGDPDAMSTCTRLAVNTLTLGSSNERQTMLAQLRWAVRDFGFEPPEEILKVVRQYFEGGEEGDVRAAQEFLLQCKDQLPLRQLVALLRSDRAGNHDTYGYAHCVAAAWRN